MKTDVVFESTPSVILTLVRTAPSKLRKMALNATVWTAFASRSL